MKFYKLELINRDNNFNKMFGTNPNVGVLDPRAGKPQTGKQIGQPVVMAGMGAMTVAIGGKTAPMGGAAMK